MLATENAVQVAENMNYEILQLPLKRPVYLVRFKPSSRIVEATYDPADAYEQAAMLDERLSSNRQCSNCGQPESWHSAIDGACSDSENPHMDSEEE